MSNTVVAYQKGNDLRSYLNGLINIPFPGLIVRSQVNAGNSVYLGFFKLSEFTGISANVEDGSMTN